MGLLGKVIGTGACLIGAGAEAIGKKIENSFLKQEQKNLEYLAKYPYKHKFIVREVKEVQSDMNFVKEFGLKKNFFVIYSSENIPIQLAYSEEKMGKCKYTLVDMQANELAVLVAKKKTCSIEYGNVKYELKSSEMFDKRKFSLINSGYKIDCNNTGSDLIIYGGGSRINIQKVPSDLGMKWGEYIVGCNDSKDVMLTVVLGIAVGTILMQSANLLDSN